jgi:hypothetical protein
MLANRRAVYKKRYKKKKRDSRGYCGALYTYPANTWANAGWGEKKTDEAIGPTSYFDMESSVTDWLLRSAERMHLETSIVLPNTITMQMSWF